MFLDNLRHSSTSITWFWAQIVECGERSSPYPRDGNLPVSAKSGRSTSVGVCPFMVRKRPDTEMEDSR